VLQFVKNKQFICKAVNVQTNGKVTAGGLSHTRKGKGQWKLLLTTTLASSGFDMSDTHPLVPPGD